MPEPNTTNIALVVPNTGDLVGAWGTSALNLNFSAIDGMLGGAVTIGLAAATTIALTLPSGSITPGAGPVQSQNALIKFTGTLTGNANITLGMPGRYVFHNSCVVGAFYVKVLSSGAGNACGLPPGQKVTLFNDGTNIDFVDTMPVGAAFDLHGATALPAWMTACTVSPYLIKDGTVYNTATYPALGAMLGSTFGGNGSSTFGVPDERARARIAYDNDSTGRLTTGVSGVNGGTMGSSGGNQNMQQHLHTLSVSITDPGHIHPQMNPNFKPASGAGGGTGGTQEVLTSGSWPTASATTSITASGTAANTGSGSSQNVQPCIVSFLPLVKT